MSPKSPQDLRPETQWDTHRPKGHPRPREIDSQDQQMATAPRDWEDDRRTGSMAGFTSDDPLARAVTNALQDDPGLAPYGLRAEVVDGIARIYGVVDTATERRHAEEVARSVPGIRGCENRVSISTDGAIDDAAVEHEVAEELAKLPFGRHITPRVAGGVVTLFGTVADPDGIRRAREAALRARGVVDVVSRIEVRPGDPAGQAGRP